MERHLLRRDRRDESLERIDRERRAQPAESVDEAREHRLGRSKSVERVEIELGAEQLANDAADLVVEGLDRHTAVRRPDADGDAVHGPPQRPVLPEVRQVLPPVPVTGGRQLEVVRLGELQHGHEASQATLTPFHFV